MKRLYFILPVAVVAFAAVVWLVDPLLLLVVGLTSLLWIGLPAALIAGILWFVALRTGRSSRPALSVISWVVAFGCIVGLAIPANHSMQQRAVASAKEYPTRVAPLLEEYRRVHGSYPPSLDKLPDKPSVPRLLRSSYGYRSDGSSYSFCFGQPGGFIDTWHYESNTRTWHLST